MTAREALTKAAEIVRARAGSGPYAESMGAYRILDSAADAILALRDSLPQESVQNDTQRVQSSEQELAAVKKAHAEAIAEWSRAEGELKALRSETATQWTPDEAKHLLAFQHEHCTNDHDAAYHEIYWLVSNRAADPYHPWAEVEALAAAPSPSGDDSEGGKHGT